MIKNEILFWIYLVLSMLSYIA